MKRKWVLSVACLVFSFTVVEAKAQDVVKVGGNGTGLAVVKALLPLFAREHPEIGVSVGKSLGSSGGIKALNAGALDVAISARALKEEERAQGAAVVFSARTPFVLMANASVPKTAITTEELEAIYAGKLNRWPVGGSIKLVLRPEGDSDTKTLQGVSPQVKSAVESAVKRNGMLIALTDEDSDRYISRIPGALGTSSLAQVATGKLTGRVLSLNGVKPSLETLASGAYPLAKDCIVVVNRSRQTPAVEKFVEFLLSAKAAAALRALAVLPDKKSSGN